MFFLEVKSGLFQVVEKKAASSMWTRELLELWMRGRKMISKVYIFLEDLVAIWTFEELDQTLNNVGKSILLLRALEDCSKLGHTMMSKRHFLVTWKFLMNDFVVAI